MSDDRVGRYRRLFPRVFRDPKFRALAAQDQVFALYVLAGPQTNRIGLFPFSISTAADDLGLSMRAARNALAQVTDTFGWQFDADARVLAIPSWWRWNHPDHDKVLIGNLKDLSQLPPVRVGRGVRPPRRAPRVEAPSDLSPGSPEADRRRLADLRRRSPRAIADLTRRCAKSGTGTGTGPRTRAGAGTQSRARGAREGTARVGRAPRQWERHRTPRTLRGLLCVYPKRVGKDAAWRAWQKRQPSAALTEQILAAVAWQRGQDGVVTRGRAFRAESGDAA